MAPLRPFLFLLGVCAIGTCTYLSAQGDPGVPPSHAKKVVPASSDAEEVPGSKARTLAAPDLTPANVPFVIDNPKADQIHSVRILSEDEMTRADRDLVADGESSIHEKAGFQNLEFNGAGWTYHQLDCPALPKHLFLRFTRDDGTRQMSMFSAAIPRDGNGSVHIIPIVRKGYSLFSPAPIGALTIAAFNRIRAEEGEGASADWVGTGLCYAALAGANPRVEPLPGSNENGALPAEIPATLRVADQGGAIIQFADMSASPKPMEWSMAFDHRGKLIKATHTPASVVRKGKTVADAEMGQAKQ